MDKQIYSLVDFIQRLSGKVSKAELIIYVREKFNLVQDRSVFYNDKFAIRFSSSQSGGFSNTIISLSSLQKYDDLPFLVCLVTPSKNFVYLANTTFLSKVSHSSQELREDNIRGSINGSDIVKNFDSMTNSPENFEKLFAIHQELGFNGNLPRLVEATNNISPSGHKYNVGDDDRKVILEAPNRALDFVRAEEFSLLKDDLDARTKKYETEIILASLIDNVNVRGRLIEYIIAGEDEALRQDIIHVLQKGMRKIPSFRTDDALGDFVKVFDNYYTATDIKTKVMVLNSAPKAYNIDKLLEFLSKPDTVFMFYFVGIMPDKILGQSLVSIFQNDLRDTTHLLKHWAGRNSRGVAQFNGNTINSLLQAADNSIDVDKSVEFLQSLIEL